MSDEVKKVVENGQPDTANDKSTVANIANPATDDKGFIPQWIYEGLPSILKDSCNVFNDRYERDVFLTGTLGVFGGCFHNLYAYNEVDKKKVATNLLAIIVGPPASGKGALNYSRKMAKEIKETFATYHKKFHINNGKKLFIPANISSSGMVQLLAKNKGVGIMVESEIDTIVNANRQEWGNYSEIIRKSFENEEYSMYRKGKDRAEHYEIESLKLSMAISGTANQFKQLMYSPDNGLFSRGMYYVFEPTEEKFVFFNRIKADTSVDEKFASFAKIANDYYQLHLTINEIQVLFTKVQLGQIGDSLQKVKDGLGNVFELAPNIKRAFITAQKIAAILSFLFECEAGTMQEKISCADTVLDLTIALTLFYLIHAYDAFDLLPSEGKVSLNNSQKRLLLILPEEFSRLDGVQTGMENGMSERGAYYSIEALEKKGLIKIQANGKYRRQ